MATRTVDVDEVVAEAASIIKGATDQERQLMRQWAFTGNTEIGTSKLTIKVSDKLTLTDFSATKPTDHWRTIDIALYDADDNEIVSQWKGFGENDQAGVGPSRTHEDVRNYVSAINITEDISYFHSEGFTGDTDNAYIIVKYHAIPLNGVGEPLIEIGSKFAVMMYIRYMWAMRADSPIGMIRDAEQSWKVARAQAQGRLKTPDVIEGKEIAKKANSMIQKPVIRNRQF